MINAKGNLIGSINSKQELSGTLNKAVEYVDPVTQEKEVIPSKEVQIIEPDKGFTGLSKVVVNPYTPVVNKKKITSNGTYNASDDNLDGYNQVEVDTGKYAPKFICFLEYMGTNLDYEINNLDTKNITNMTRLFSDCNNLISLPNFDTQKVTTMGRMFNGCVSLKEIPEIDTSNCTYANYMFANCQTIKKIPNLDTSKVKSANYMFQSCYALTSIPKLNANSLTSLNGMFAYCRNLEEFGGLENLGIAFLPTANANYSYYTFKISDSSKATHDTLLNVFNGLADLITLGVTQQQLIIGSGNIEKCLAEEIAIVTNKGWAVS